MVRAFPASAKEAPAATRAGSAASITSRRAPSIVLVDPRLIPAGRAGPADAVAARGPMS
jgi:hypothetical protein